MRGVDYSAIDSWLNSVWNHAGTDLLLSVGAPPLARLDGHLQPLDREKPMSADDTERIILSMVDEDRRRDLHEHRQTDFSFEWEGNARIRANAFYQRDTLAIGGNTWIFIRARLGREQLFAALAIDPGE